MFSRTNLQFPSCLCSLNASSLVWCHNFFFISRVESQPLSIHQSQWWFSVESCEWQLTMKLCCFGFQPISRTIQMCDWLEWLLQPAAVQQVTLLKSLLHQTIVFSLFWLAFIILSIHLESFGTHEDCSESVKIYEGSVAHHAATLGDAPHANMTPVAWQPDRQRSDPPFWAEQQGPALLTLISHYRTVWNALLNHVENWLSWNN